MSHPPQEQVLRARGWSIQSDGTAEMTQAEKISSLQQSIAEGEPDRLSPQQQSTTHTSQTNHNNKRPLVDEETSNHSHKRSRLESDASYPSIATSDDSSLLFPPAPQDAQEDKDDSTTKPPASAESSTSDNAPNQLSQVAKSRLSKWAARLFDPDRPRSLIQPPQTIPLNDEFLQAFGRREKEYDKAMGVTLEIEHEIEDDDDDKNDVVPDRKLDTTTTTTNTKVKISNLKYTTTAATLQAACLKFGSLELVNLIMDTERENGLNKGVAYVTFSNADAAQACLDGLSQLDGRNLTVTWAADAVSSNRRTSSSSQRYWIKDMSTKCYRCGLVGHMEADCDNEPMAKPCPLCALTGHDFRNCPNKAVCFNCGVPGHVSRECRRPRGLPPQRVCTVCLQSDHNQWQCRRGPPMRLFGIDQVVCMTCHQPGHHLCQDMKWFFGLDGVSCCNCGLQGHTGNQCDRPNLEACNRNEQLGVQEIARAGTYTAVDHVARQSDRRGGREAATAKTNHRGRGGDSKQRAKSMPPQKRGPRQPSKSPGRRRGRR